MSSFEARQEMSNAEGYRNECEEFRIEFDENGEDYEQIDLPRKRVKVEELGSDRDERHSGNGRNPSHLQRNKTEYVEKQISLPEDVVEFLEIPAEYVRIQSEMGDLVENGIDCEDNQLAFGFRKKQTELQENGFGFEENRKRFGEGRNECPARPITSLRNLNRVGETPVQFREESGKNRTKIREKQSEHCNSGQIAFRENPTIECGEYLTQFEENESGENTLILPENRAGCFKKQTEIGAEDEFECDETPDRFEGDGKGCLERQLAFFRKRESNAGIQDDGDECEEKPIEFQGELDEFEEIGCSEYQNQFGGSEENLFELSNDFNAMDSDEQAKRSNSQLEGFGSGEHGHDGQMEYDVLDDLLDEGRNALSSGEENDWVDSEDDEDVPEEEIDALLDEKLDEYRKRKRPRKSIHGDEMAHEEREKIILKVRGKDHFEVLPEGWIEVTHNSGMPVYLHKVTRVCTLSKPYFLGPGSARKHEVPIAAIPCLQYRREVENEKQTSSSEAEPRADVAAESVDGAPPEAADSAPRTDLKLPKAKIETVQENTKEKSLDYMELREYCQKLFEFKTIKVRRFKTWAGRRKHQKRMKQMHRPTLPIGTKLITCPLPPVTDKEGATTSNPRRAEFVMNPNGKSYVCILHEYVQHAMRVQPRYLFRELDNSTEPYGATVIINEMEYGSGFGSSKKQAKLEAAKSTLEILIPQMKHINPDGREQGVQQQDLAFFDEVRVEDPRVSELCAKAGHPSPYQILLECLKRNYGMGDTQIKLEMQSLKHQKNAFVMTVGKHKVEVVCKNKKDGKQRASQGILKLLHSHIDSWGSLLRLYGKGSCKTLKEKKLEEQQITELQCRTTANKPNQSILCKLREEMLKLREIRNSLKPIGKFIPTDVELPPSVSVSNLKNVDL